MFSQFCSQIRNKLKQKYLSEDKSLVKTEINELENNSTSKEEIQNNDKNNILDVDKFINKKQLFDVENFEF
jgi:hypothetical protein